MMYKFESDLENPVYMFDRGNVESLGEASCGCV